ncbi:MAG: ester cyclase [Anaerolineales bacterium]
MSTEENKALVRRYQEAHNTNNLAALDEIVSADLIPHNQLPGLPSGLEGGKLVHQGLLAAFPDLHTETEDLIAEGDKVVQRFTVSGTDKGGFMGAPPTDKHYKVSGISIFRIANGKIVEHWGQFDQLGVLQQLGVMPAA